MKGEGKSLLELEKSFRKGMKMLNAKEARELSKSQFEVVNGLILEEINEKITEAAELGLFVCRFDYIINSHTIEVLKDLGYTVEVKSYRNEEQTIIEW